MSKVFASFLIFHCFMNFVYGFNIQIHSVNVSKSISEEAVRIPTENVVTISTENSSKQKRPRKRPASASTQNFDLTCSTNLDDLPIPTEAETSEAFIQVEKNCVYERILTYTAASNETKSLVQYLNLKTSIILEDFNETLSIECDNSTTNEKVLQILKMNLPSVKTVCFEKHIPVELTVENDLTTFICPGTYTRTIKATNTCSGDIVRRNQTVAFVSSCVEGACGQGLEPSHGTCVDGKCVCADPWAGLDCELESLEDFTEEFVSTDNSLTDNSTTSGRPPQFRPEFVRQQTMANWFWSIGAVVIPAAILVAFTAVYYLVNQYMKPDRDENQNSDLEKAESQNPNSLKREAQYELKPFLQNNANR